MVMGADGFACGDHIHTKSRSPCTIELDLVLRESLANADAIIDNLM